MGKLEFPAESPSGKTKKFSESTQKIGIANAQNHKTTKPQTLKTKENNHPKGTTGR